MVNYARLAYSKMTHNFCHDQHMGLILPITSVKSNQLSNQYYVKLIPALSFDNVEMDSNN
jgi:hypothetical protein